MASFRSKKAKSPGPQKGTDCTSKDAEIERLEQKLTQKDWLIGTGDDDAQQAIGHHAKVRDAKIERLTQLLSDEKRGRKLSHQQHVKDRKDRKMSHQQHVKDKLKHKKLRKKMFVTEWRLHHPDGSCEACDPDLTDRIDALGIRESFQLGEQYLFTRMTEDRATRYCASTRHTDP